MNSTGLPDAYRVRTKSDILYGKGSLPFSTTPTPDVDDAVHHPQQRRRGSRPRRDRLLRSRRAAESPGFTFFFCHAPIVDVRVPRMDIDPQAVIDALSRQIGALQTENTILKMALQQHSEAAALQLAESHGAADINAAKTKKSAPATKGEDAEFDG